MTYVAKKELIFSNKKGNKFYQGFFQINKRALRELNQYGFIFKGKTKILKTITEQV